jgi:TP901 family phage tail tape measure protein
MARTIKTVFEVMAQTRGTASINKVSNAFADLKKQARGAKGAMSTAASRMEATKKSAIGGAFQTMAIGGGFQRVGAGIGQFVKQTVDHAGALEFELANLKGISGASADSMNRLSEAAKRAGIETQFTPTETVQSLAALAQQGFTTEQQLSSLNAVLMLSGASGGKVPLADAATVTTQTLKAFGLEADKAGVTVDQLVKTTTLSGLGIDEISDAMQNASAGAISMNVSLESTLATLGLIKNIIPSASMAGSAFQVLTGRLASGKTQKKLKQEIGLDVVDPKTGKFKEFGELIVDISSKLGKMSEGKRGKLIGEAFGERAKKGILSVMAQLQKGITTQNGKVLKGAKAWAHWKKQLDPKTVQGFAKSLNDLKLDTLTGQIQLLSGSMQTFQIELGKGVASLTKGAIKAFLSVFNKIIELFSALPKPVKTAISGFLAFSAVLLTIVGTVFILKGAMSLLGISFGSIMTSIASIIAVVIPLTLAFGALALTAYSFYRAFTRNIGGIGDSASTMMEKIKVGYQAVVDLVSGRALSEETLAELDRIGSKGLNKFVNLAGVVIANLRSFFDGIVDGFDDNLSTLAAPFERLKNALGEVFAPFLNAAGNAKTDIDAWGNRGNFVGIIMSQLAVNMMNVVTWVVEAAGQFSKFIAGVTWEDIVDGAKKFLAILTPIAKVLLQIGDYILLISAARKQFKGIELNRQEKLAVVGINQGEEARKELRLKFKAEDEIRKQVVEEQSGTGTKFKAGSIAGAAIRSVASARITGSVEQKDQREKEAKEKDSITSRMLKSIEKINAKKSVKTVNANILLDKEVIGKTMMKWTEGEEEDDFSIEDMSPSGAGAD